MYAIRTVSIRLVMVVGALVLATAGIVGSVAVVGAGPAVAAGTITQPAPTTGTVTTTGSAAFTDHLRTIGYTGPVTFVKTSGGGGINVSSRGKITTSGTLAVGNYTANGTVADAFGDTGSFAYTLTVTAVTISQTAPTTGTVTTTGSAAFTDHLNTTGNIGKRSFVKTGGGRGLKVSFGGMITTTGTLASGTYTASGTVADHFGDTGTFTYTLTVKAVTISQTVPTSGTVTTTGSDPTREPPTPGP